MTNESAEKHNHSKLLGLMSSVSLFLSVCYRLQICGTDEFSAPENNRVYQVSFVATVLAGICQLWAVNFNMSACQQTERADSQRLDFVFSVPFPSGKQGYTHSLSRSLFRMWSSMIGSNVEKRRQRPWPWGAQTWDDKHPLCDSALRTSVYHPGTTEVDFCCTLLTSIVFQRQPPGGKPGKQLIHPHSVHKHTI